MATVVGLNDWWAEILIPAIVTLQGPIHETHSAAAAKRLDTISSHLPTRLKPARRGDLERLRNRPPVVRAITVLPGNSCRTGPFHGAVHRRMAICPSEKPHHP